jgi:hypothetical protein
MAIYGDQHNVSLAETNVCLAVDCGPSWIDFQGYMATDKSIQARFQFSEDGLFTGCDTNESALETGVYSIAGSTTDANSQIYNTHWKAQAFLTGASQFYITNVTLKILRPATSLPGLLYARLYAADAAWNPTGAILSSGSRDASSVSTTGEWFNITMSTYYLAAVTRYCIVIFNYDGSFNHVKLFYATGTSYTDGVAELSADSGGTWTNWTTYDFLFKVYGTEPGTDGTSSNTTIASTSLFDILQSSLNYGKLYYYRVAANDTAGNYTRGNIRTTLTEPQVPTFLNMTPSISNSSLYISWVTGTGANQTLIVNGGDSYPTDETDGTILYNGTGTSIWLHNISFNTTYSLSLFSYTVWGSLCRFSGGVSVPWGGISFNCYNESSGLPIGFNVLISNKAGDHVYYGPDLNGFRFINITEIPLGEQIGFFVSNQSGLYNARLYYFDLTGSIFYNLSFYLPMTTTPPILNDSYYYLITVINEAGQTIEGVYLDVSTYINTTDSFETVSSGYTDGNGQFTAYLMPNHFYKINSSKDGYQWSITDYVPSPSVYTFTIKLYFDTTTPTTTYLWPEQHTFTGSLDNTTGILTMTYDDFLSQTEDWTMYVWRINPNGTDTLIQTYIGTNDSFTLNLAVNTTYDYHVLIWVNHTTFGRVFDEWTTYGYHYHPTGKAAKFNLLMTLNFGFNPFGWSNTVGLFIVLGILFSFGRRETYLSAILLGVLLLFLDIYIGFPTVWNALASGVFPVLIIFIGVLMMIRDRGMSGAS